MCHESTLDLGRNRAEVSEARRFVRTSMASWGVNELDVAYGIVDALTLATSELVSNAIEHSIAGPQLKLTSHRHVVEVSVQDYSVKPPLLGAATPEDSSGRGLAIVNAVSDVWGYRLLTAHTKEVWCRFHVGAGSALAIGCVH